MVAEPSAQPRGLGLGVGIGAELAAAGQKADISLEIMRFGEEIVWQVKQFLKILVPRREIQVLVEHHDAVAHVIESNAQLGLPLADLTEQPRILDRDYRL